MTGDGSATKPWHTLAEVVNGGLFANTPVIPGRTVVTNPPIQPGDTVYLRSGNHGSVVIQGAFGAQVLGYMNSTFITIAAAPGQTPVLQGLTIIGASHWAFSGLTIQGLNTTGVHIGNGTTNQDFYLVSLRGPHDNIVIDSATIQSTTDVSQWTISDWQNQRASGVQDLNGSCIAITNSKFTNVGFGIQTQGSDFVLISGNTINYFADDGIDFGSNNLIIQQNLIENSIEDGDGFHRDGMQGQPYNEQTVIENVKITGNTVIRITDPNIPYPGYMQGIDAFDGIWKNMVVSNNVVITDAWDGIAFDGITNAVISGNYLLVDNREVLPCYGLRFAACLTQSVIYDYTTMPTLYVSPSKAGAPSQLVTITGNIVTALDVDISTITPTISNNLCIQTAGKCVLGMPINGKMMWLGNPGTYGADNVIAGFGPNALFTQFDTTAMQYNLTLTAPNPALAN